MVSDPSNVPHLPIPPNRVTRLRSVVNLMMSTLATRDDVDRLARELFDHPEADFYCFAPPSFRTAAFVDAVKGEQLTVREWEDSYYPHPEFRMEFIRLHPGQVQHDWQREVVTKGPKLERLKIELTAKRAREIDVSHRLDLERQILGPSAPRAVGPSAHTASGSEGVASKPPMSRLDVIVDEEIVSLQSSTGNGVAPRGVGWNYLVHLLENPATEVSARTLLASSTARALNAPVRRWNGGFSAEFSVGAIRAGKGVTIAILGKIRDLWRKLSDGTETRNSVAANEASAELNEILSLNELEIDADGWVRRIGDPAIRGEQNSVAKRIREALRDLKSKCGETGRSVAAAVKLAQGRNRFQPQDTPVEVTVLHR